MRIETVKSVTDVKEKHQKVDVIYVTEKVEDGLVANPLEEMVEKSYKKLKELLTKIGADGIVNLRISFEDIVRRNNLVTAGRLIIYDTAVKFK